MKPQVKPQISICLKCKHCVKTYPFFPRGPIKIMCRTPGDSVTMDYATGKVTYAKYNWKRHNQHGSCHHYKKLWYRRPTYVKPLLGILLMLAMSVGCAPAQPGGHNSVLRGQKVNLNDVIDHSDGRMSRLQETRWGHSRLAME